MENSSQNKISKIKKNLLHIMYRATETSSKLTKGRRKGQYHWTSEEWKGIDKSYASMPFCDKYLYYIVEENQNWTSVDLFAPKPWIKTNAGPLVPAFW